MSNKIESGILTKTKETRERRKMGLRTDNIIKLSKPHYDFTLFPLKENILMPGVFILFYEITKQLRIEVKSKLLKSACVCVLLLKPKRQT